MAIHVPVSAGEFFDRLTILQIKREKIREPAKLGKILDEMRELIASNRPVAEQMLSFNEREGTLSFRAPEVKNLYRINLRLWQVEDEIRDHEKASDFSGSFIELARSVYKLNDERFQLKLRINKRMQSEIEEVKSYADWSAPSNAR